MAMSVGLVILIVLLIVCCCSCLCVCIFVKSLRHRLTGAFGNSSARKPDMMMTSNQPPLQDPSAFHSNGVDPMGVAMPYPPPTVQQSGFPEPQQGFYYNNSGDMYNQPPPPYPPAPSGPYGAPPASAPPYPL